MTEQQIPKGYKLTEVGVIPDDWEVKTYGDIFNFLSTANNSRSDLVNSGSIGYIHYGDIHTKWNYYLDLNKSEIPYLKSNIKISASLIKNGDIIMADASEDYEGVGKSVEVIDCNDRNVISGLHTFLLRDNNLTFELGFRAYLHSITQVKVAFYKLATGLKVYSLSKTILKTISLPIPPKKEQTAIANALSDTDALVNQLKKLITKKQAIKTATMQQLLTGKTRLPEFAYRADGSLKGTKISELGDIPEGWDEVKLEALVNYANGAAHEGDIKDYGEYIVVNSKFISTEGRIRKYTNKGYSLAKKDDILMVMSDVPDGRALAKCFIVDQNSLYTVNQRICSLTSRTINAVYLLFILDRNKYFLQFDDGAKQTNLRKKDVLMCPVLTPLLDEQTAIATILSEMDQEITLLETHLAKTEQIKQGMMQQLLTGKIRLI